MLLLFDLNKYFFCLRTIIFKRMATNYGEQPNYGQQPAYGQPPQQGQQQVIVVNQPGMVNHDFCPTCKNVTGTRTEAEAGTGTWLICLGMCLLGWWCCCCIPFCVEELQDRRFFCTTCNTMKSQKKLMNWSIDSLLLIIFIQNLSYPFEHWDLFKTIISYVFSKRYLGIKWI